MPEDVNEALERFRIFLDRFSLDATIDEESGFTANDGNLLAGEIEMLAIERHKEQQFSRDGT